MVLNYIEKLFSLGAPEKTVPLPTGDRSTNLSLKHINHFGNADEIISVNYF